VAVIADRVYWTDSQYPGDLLYHVTADQDHRETITIGVGQIDAIVAIDPEAQPTGA
jgi:hypothetical protein